MISSITKILFRQMFFRDWTLFVMLANLILFVNVHPVWALTVVIVFYTAVDFYYSNTGD